MDMGSSLFLVWGLWDLWDLWDASLSFSRSPGPLVPLSLRPCGPRHGQGISFQPGELRALDRALAEARRKLFLRHFDHLPQVWLDDAFARLESLLSGLF